LLRILKIRVNLYQISIKRLNTKTCINPRNHTHTHTHTHTRAREREHGLKRALYNSHSHRHTLIENTITNTYKHKANVKIEAPPWYSQ